MFRRVLLAMTLLFVLSSAAAAQVPEPRTTNTEVEILNDEGGAVFITGEATYTFPYFRLFLPEPYVVLYDSAGLVERNIDFYPSAQSQVFGTITSDPFTSPFSYELPLPVRPRGELRDVDNNGQADAGVMIFSLLVISNTWANPFIEIRDNYVAGIINSALVSTDVDSFLEVEGGTLLIYAPDEKQSFPTGYGADGRLFTADDPTARLPQGYTLVNLDEEAFVFDRAAEPNVPLLEAEDAELDDFSDLSYVEAFDAMIDLLSQEYAFTEYKGIDWQALRDEFRPLVEDAQSESDVEAFRAAIYELSLRIPDGHVSGPFSREAYSEAVRGGLGFAVRELDDGRVLTSYMVAGGPADLAGMKPRAEILEIDDNPTQKALAEARLWQNSSTDHNRRLDQLRYVVRFPEGTRVSVTFRNPGDEVQTVNLTAVYDQDSLRNSGYQETGEALTPGELPIEYIIRADGFAYVKIYSFSDDLQLTVNLWERFIDQISTFDILGVVIDLRENGGGSGFLGDQLPAYFFDDEYVIGTSARYSERRGEYVINPAEQDEFILPANGLAYAGPVAVIISPDCASACEGFAFAMTVNNRATMIGHYPTAGLGGSVVPIALPDNTDFSYTNSRSLDADGNIVIEGKGVQPTVRVPVTEETLFSEEDVLLNVAFDTLRDQLNFVELGERAEGELVNGEAVLHRVSLTEGDQFSIAVTSDDFTPVVRVYTPGIREPIIEETARSSTARINELRAPFDVTLTIEVEADSADAGGNYQIEIINDAE